MTGRADGVGELSGDERGRWIAAAAAGLAFVGTAILLAAVLATLDYDFEDGTLAPFEPARGAFVLVAGTFLAAIVLFSGVAWRRWVAILGYAVGASWLLFAADFEPLALPGVLVAATTLGVATVLLLVPRSVQRFFGAYEGAGGRLAQPLGPLTTEADVRRWITIIDRWIEMGVLTPGERARLRRTLASWLSSHPDLQARFAGDLERMASHHVAWRRLADMAARARRLVRRSRAAT